jgi:hypothetical protein
MSTSTCFRLLRKPNRLNFRGTVRPGTYISRLLAILEKNGGGSIKAVRREAYHWSMQRMNQQCTDPDSSDPSLSADILLREEPEDEEEDDEEERDGGEEDNDGDEGYSE